MDEILRISRDELYQPTVDSTLAHQKALVRQSQPIVEQPVSPLRRVLLSNLFYTPLAGLLGALSIWMILEPSLDDNDLGETALLWWLLMPLTAMSIVLFIFISDGIASRRLRGNPGRWISGIALTVLFSLLAYVPTIVLLFIFGMLSQLIDTPNEDVLKDVRSWPFSLFLLNTIWRSLAWLLHGAALGLGMNLMRSTSAQRRASVMGGAVGGALGGLFFDSIHRFLFPAVEQGSIMRVVGFCILGLCVGIFVALSERLGREGWVRVRTGPLRGKAFILYHNPTIIGSSPRATIYLFKDAKVAPEHAALHRVGGGYEVAEVSSDSPIILNSVPVHRRRLVSGDQITIGDTILDFEERAGKRSIQPGIKEQKA